MSLNSGAGSFAPLFNLIRISRTQLICVKSNTNTSLYLEHFEQLTAAEQDTWGQLEGGSLFQPSENQHVLWRIESGGNFYPTFSNLQGKK